MDRNLKPFTSKECKIIAFLAEGYTYKQIGDKLKWSEHTVEDTLLQMRQKLEVKHPFELISWAYMTGILV
ncbi:helix-turn-helix transcriptional regulator [Pontibacter locisalis]|uniref:Helix-turn-helix transcriptional regulator n=1 Tax=Pontibacter locisalis TaxID=1719035 RepID=A0ABW5IFL8_9BACT